jgi:hypothetical protein
MRYRPALVFAATLLIPVGSISGAQRRPGLWSSRPIPR